MPSKTPQFDALLDPILNALVPHTRECVWKGMHSHCESSFEITNEDIEFLRMLRVPAPNYCPTCRRIRRMGHAGIMKLFKRNCSVPGHTETIISIYGEECPFPVYDYMYFIGDQFDPFIFGTEYKDGSPMEKLFEMRKHFPVPSFLNRDPSSINSEYSNGGRNTKNAYYAGGCYGSEDIWYSQMAGQSRMVMDSRMISSSEFVHGSLCSDHLYKCISVFFSSNCTDSMFLFDCKNCTDCFGSVNLRNARYVVFNEQLSKEGYEEFMASITPFSRATFTECSEHFWKLIKESPMNASQNVGSKNTFGVRVDFSEDVYNCVEVSNSQHIRYSDSALSHKDSMDILFSGGNSHHLYGTINVGSHSSGVRFSIASKFCTDCEFVFNSKQLTNCFMCFGLQNKSYCILNKQYEAEEYFKIIDQIKSEMLQRGEYSDGPDFNFSAQAYNFSLAAIPYPLSDSEIHALGGYIASEPDTNIQGMDTIEASLVPETIAEVADDFILKAIICSVTGRPFRIIESELVFYRRMGIPLPIVHPSVRIENQYRMAQNGKMYRINCAHCGTSTTSMFDPRDEYNLYCEKCYQTEVI